MQITLNQSEVEQAIQAHVDNLVTLAGDCHITVNEDGTALVIIGEEVHSDDNPPVVTEKKTRKPRQPREAKHVMVEQKTQTNVGGQNESSMQEAESAAQAEGDNTDPTEQLKEEATAEAEEAQAEVDSQETAVQEQVAEDEAVKPASSKPSLFANLRRN